MTRMVEDQRTQIGTLKALGYSKFAIMSKYINYALLATVGGSICGVLIGEKVLPYIIISAYGIMYHNMASNLQIHYEFTYARRHLWLQLCVHLAQLYFPATGAFRNAGFSYETACTKRRKESTSGEDYVLLEAFKLLLEVYTSKSVSL